MNPQQQILPIQSIGHIRDVAVGSNHSIALAQNGEGIWVWGKADFCNLGFHAQSSAICTPQYLEIPAQNASAGNQHSFIWRKSQVYCWGSNKDYKLGLDQPKQYELTKSQIFAEAIQTEMQLMQISCGDSHSLAVFKLEDQSGVTYPIFAWGESKSHQLALEAAGTVTQPILIDFTEPIRNIYSKNDYNFIVTMNGDLYSWGTNLFGRLGFQNTIKNQKLPSNIKNLIRIKSISMGKFHCMAITQQLQVFSWGHGLHGQLGINEIVSQSTPTKIQLSQKIIQSSCGEYHSVILTQDLYLMSCGSNSYFALGHNQVDQKKRCKKFVKVELMQTVKIRKIVSGNRHNLLLDQKGKVFSWGCNKYGQLGRMGIQDSQISIKRQLYKQLLNPNNPNEQMKGKEMTSPFSQIRENFSPASIKQQNSSCFVNKLADWKARYEKFKAEKQKQQQKLLRQLDDILRQGS